MNLTIVLAGLAWILILTTCVVMNHRAAPTGACRTWP